MIRVGLVGAGPWASLFTAPMLASAPGMALAAVWARRPAAADALAHQHAAAAVDSFDDLLAACDAVAFTVPAIADEFARAVRREFRQPLDVHHGVRLQRLIAAVAESLDTGGGVSVRGPGLGGRSDDEGG